jgi:hypothetical protein
VVAHTCNPSYLGSIGRRIEAHGEKCKTQKQTKARRTGAVSQVVEHLPSKLEALSSISSTTKNVNKFKPHLKNRERLPLAQNL